MKRALQLKKLMIQFFILLFTINVSFCILSGGFILSYGLFGEVTALFTVENQVSSFLGVQSDSIKINANKKNKIRINIEQQKVRNKRVVSLVAILAMLFLQNSLRSIYYITPVRLKVRMNN